MSYTHTSYIQFRQALAQRLHDSSNVFWLDAELKLYTLEALRVFGALSAFWRERNTFATANNTAFYDLPTYLATQLSHTVTDRDLINLIQYHLMEPATSNWAGGWTGTEQFTMTDVANAVQARRNQFLSDTGMVLTRSTSAVPAPPQGRVTLTDTIIDVRRVMWSDASGTKTQVWREDEWALNAFSPTWANDAGLPYAYSVLAPPPLTIQLAPVPANNGTLDLVTVNAGAALTPTAGASVLGIPDDWCWVVKWGALADLLGKDGQARDPARAQFCEQRYQQGVKLARLAGCIVQLQLQGVNLFTQSLAELDAYAPNWQNDAAASPTDVGIAGYNLVALRPIPNGIYSITVDVIRKCPVPSADGDQLQVGREQVDMLLDYAEHLASFKMAGAELAATGRAAQNFLIQSLTYNDRLSAAARNIFVERDQSTREKGWRPRRTETESLGTARESVQ